MDEAKPAAGEGGFVFLSPEAVPKRWMSRAVNVALVPLLPEEANRVLSDQAAEPSMGRETQALARLVAQGLTARKIALQLGVSLRTVYRGLADLRERFGVVSREELVSRLAERGFGR